MAATAKAHFKQGRMHYQLGEYREALDQFKEAYRLKQDPSFLYNIAQCHRQLREYAEAIRLYGNYLREAPDADNRDEVERQIRDLKTAAEKQRQQASAPPVAPIAPGSPEPIGPLPPATASMPAPSAGPAGSADFPSFNSSVPSASVVSGAVDASRDAQLEVIPDPPEANILVNHISMARRGPAKLRLPPGLYSVALEREGFRGAEGAVTLVAGGHTTLAGTLTETKTHGWRYVGFGLLGVGVLSGGVAIYSYAEGDQKRTGSADFNTYASWARWTQGVTCSSPDGILGPPRRRPGASNTPKTGGSNSPFPLARGLRARPNTRSMVLAAQESDRGRSSAPPRSRKCVAAIFLATLGLLCFGRVPSAFAQALDDEACAQCHATDQTETDGKELKAVTPELFKGTPHQALGCTACHKVDAASDIPEGRTGHKPFDPVDCSVCHQSSMVKAENQGIPLLYRNSVHGMARLGNHDPRAPLCQNCHGSHHILSPTEPDSRVSRKNVTATCSSCHVDREDKSWQMKGSDRVKAYASSIHGRFNQAFTNLPAAVCTDCHGEHDIAKVSKKESYVDRYKLPQTCSKCHQKIAEAYQASVHGKLLAQGNKDVPTCSDCHGEHTIQRHDDPNSPVYSGNVTKTCSACHQNALLSSRYQMPPNREATYKTSFHGIAQGFGDKRAANCASCHGSHNILPSTDPKSRVNPKNLGETCGNCHAGPSRFLALGKIHQNQTLKDNPLVFLIKLSYIILIVATVGGFIAYIVLDLFSHYARRLFARLQGRDPEPRRKRAAGKVYLRFPVSYRIQHIIMMLSFLTLIFTGLPILFPESSFFKGIFNTPGSFQLRGLIHRGAAIVLITLVLVHTIFVLSSRRARKDLVEMMPRIKDYKDFRQLVAFNLGRSKDRPAYARFNFIEKFEYLAVVWGSIVMGVTGFMLWFPGWSMRHMPKLALDVAAAIHGYEAALAFLAIIIWHLYSVIFSPDVWPMSKVWLTGEMSEEEMEHHHPLELEKLKEAEPPAPDDAGKDKK